MATSKTSEYHQNTFGNQIYSCTIGTPHTTKTNKRIQLQLLHILNFIKILLFRDSCVCRCLLNVTPQCSVI